MNTISTFITIYGADVGGGSFVCFVQKLNLSICEYCELHALELFFLKPWDHIEHHTFGPARVLLPRLCSDMNMLPGN